MITTPLKLRPFQTPNFVIPELPPGRREDGLRTDHAIPLHMLEDGVIRQLLDQFCADVWAKVNARRSADRPALEATHSGHDPGASPPPAA